MFGHKSFLRIGALSDSSISGLYKDSYELESCSYSFSQGVDINGKPQTEVRGGTIILTYSGLPQNDMLRWMLDSTKYEDGSIVLCNEDNEPLEKVFFQQAACIDMVIEYTQKGKSYIETRITLQARIIKVGETTLENRWTINK
ncbi:type VI secretion system tube protein TssD [uncultured Bacteroides sp.]|uniref:type VI secretion system tube protein TssD n=1 Tax=uncultured Bacteroides sp. TaxID=162156 RepID=UPI0025F92722|nr:type VI secretion system tube protein TssD [uncultured Bacteroides sp.]